MHLPKCFICNTKTLIYCENVFVLRSCHTETLIIEFLQKFAEELDLSTSWNKSRKYEKTVICQICMIKINEYDLACMTAKDMEKQLKNLLRNKEELNEIESDEDYNPEVVFSDDGEERGYEPISKGIQVNVMRCNVCQINFKRYKLKSQCFCVIS